MTDQDVLPRRRGRTQSTVPQFDAVDPALDDPVERQVYRSIRRGMMRGLVSPDMVLTGRSLAGHMNLSVQPVRDALKRLEADGVIVGRPQSGFHLPGMTAKEYWESIEIRTRLEGLAGRLAAPRMMPSQIAELRRLNAEMITLEARDAYLAANFAFHFAIYSRADRAGLLALIENFWVRIGPVLHNIPTQHAADTVSEKHERIIAALEQQDGEAAELAIVADLVGAAHLVVRGLPENS